MMEIKEEDVSFSRLKLMTQKQDSKSKLMTQERIFSIIINQTKKGTNKAWMVSHDMMLTCHMHEGIPLELNPVLKLLEMHKGCWWAICTTCVVSLSNEHMSRCDPFSTTMMMTTIMHKYIPVE